MKILSLDTTMAACSAAIIDTDRTPPLAAAFVAMERGHAEALPPMVAEVVAQSGLGFSDIDRIAVTIGPGTFTGLRIGLSFARGLGLAAGIPVAGIDSLSAIAANEAAKAPLLVVSDARNDEVYAAVFDPDRKLISAPHVTSASGAAAGLPSGTLVMGTAARAVLAAGARNELVLSLADDLPIAAHFARLAKSLTPGAMPAPLYLRAPDAKPQSSQLRKISELSIETVGAAASELLSTLHDEIFEEGWSAQAFAEMLAVPGTHAAVASESGVPLAFIVTRGAADEAEIITVGSRPSVQRRGVARQLLAWHGAWLSAHGVRQVFLEVAASNAAAQALYRGCGFAEVGRRRGYYRRRDGVEDAVVMRRELDP
jgi:tRNA threonylcarbamoyladenosine biosynthesis protein TsaB